MESKIRNTIENINKENRKALTLFLTSGFPYPENFVEMSLGVIEKGADIIEIGIPFGDSLADGPVIQSSYAESLNNNTDIETTLKYVSEIKRNSDCPVVLMGSANPVLHYGKKEFVKAAAQAGVNGVIIPDVPLEEYDDFFEEHFKGLDTILLTTPTSERRISEIDKKSSGFVYCVSVVGITGERKNFDEYVLQNIKNTYESISLNKMQIGFGISNAENIRTFSPYCDGVIVGSALIRQLKEDNNNFTKTFAFVESLKSACNN